MKTFTVKKFLGVRNDVAHDRYAPGDLSVGSNIELDESGKITTRLGVTLKAAGSYHSIYSNGEYGYVVKNGVMTYLDGQANQIPIMPVTGASVAYASVDADTYWSDGVAMGILTAATNRAWGIAPPPPVIAVNVSVAPVIPTDGIKQGTLVGAFIFAMTYVRNGEESGASVYIAMQSAGNIQLTLPVSQTPGVDSKNVYMSTMNGESPYLIATVPNSMAKLTVPPNVSYGPVIRTRSLGPMPPGWLVKAVGGRLFTAQDNVLTYSLPFELGLTDPRSFYVMFDSEVRTFAPVSDGVYVGTADFTYWLEGLDPTQWKQKIMANYGTVRGTELFLPNTMVSQDGVTGGVAAWMSARGFCIGMDGGQTKDLTGQRFIPPIARNGATLLKIRSESPQVVMNLFS